MTKRARMLLTVLLVLGAATWAQADHLQQPAERLARLYGCRAEVVTSDQHSVVQSVYDYVNDVLYIGTYPDTPDYVFVTVVLHEIGHCLQDQEDRLRGRYLQEVELEADMLAAELACQAGLDGRKLLHDTFVWAYEEFGYEGDPNHGTIQERIRQGYLAPSCNVKRTEAPFLT